MLQIYYPVTLMMCFWGAFQCDKHGSNILVERGKKNGLWKNFFLFFYLFWQSKVVSICFSFFEIGKF